MSRTKEPLALAGLFDSFASGTKDVDGFDEALWSFLCKKVNSGSDVSELPEAVRNFYASRYLEWEVGNGGFAQAAYNIPHLFEPAQIGYAALGLSDAAALIAKAQQLIDEGAANFKGDTDDIGELFAEFVESSLSPLNERLDEVGWWATVARSAYALSHRKDFESVA